MTDGRPKYNMEAVTHPIAPVYNEESRILILGSFPSVKSREAMFFYGHPQNRFWRVLAKVFSSDVPISVDEKKDFLLSNGIAVWDVIASCEIIGSSDSSIKNAVPNDITDILSKSKIKRIILNGGTAFKYYEKYLIKNISTEAVCLPSTSPANAKWSIDMLALEWGKYLK